MSKEFGVSGLSQLFNGGLDEVSSIGLLGVPGTNREIFNYSFVEEGVKNNEPCLYYCSTQKLDLLHQEFDKRGIDESDFLEVIDGYSWKLKRNNSNEDYVMGSSNLNEFLKLFYQAREEIGSNGRTIIDSLGNLVGFDNLSTVNNLLQVLLAEEKDSNNLVLISLTPNYRESIVDLVKSYVDGFIELNKFNAKKFLKVHWMGESNVSTNWHRFSVSRGVSEDSSFTIDLSDAVTNELNKELSNKSHV